jgi:hypothetical protein
MRVVRSTRTPVNFSHAIYIPFSVPHSDTTLGAMKLNTGDILWVKNREWIMVPPAGELILLAVQVPRVKLDLFG